MAGICCWGGTAAAKPLFCVPLKAKNYRVGSSNMRSRGRTNNAQAIATRTLQPPLSWEIGSIHCTSANPKPFSNAWARARHSGSLSAPESFSSE
mmetsp:Transcript_8246/g.9883  ORF Transcript_8246/g.9883 Transcript_8246/m.9883 type:complete len:94 (+) Transcript_8246:187-468(+)